MSEADAFNKAATACLERQRNDALNAVASLTGQLAMLQARLAERDARIAELEAPKRRKKP